MTKMSSENQNKEKATENAEEVPLECVAEEPPNPPVWRCRGRGNYGVKPTSPRQRAEAMNVGEGEIEETEERSSGGRGETRGGRGRGGWKGKGRRGGRGGKEGNFSRGKAKRIKRKAVRAAIFLLPLMGIAHILFFYHKFNTAWKFALWSYSAYFLITFQGFFVAVLYCFLNGEVQAAIKNSFYLYMSLRNYDYTPGRHFTLVSVLGEDGSIQNGDQPTWNQCCKPNPTTPDGKEIRFQHLNRKDTSTVITELTMVESNLRRSSSREKLSGNANEVSDTSLIQLRNTP